MNNRITKMYPNGRITLEAAFFPPILQEVIDSEINSSPHFALTVQRLKEYEDRDSKGCELCNEKKIVVKERVLESDLCPTIEREINNIFCPNCGKKLR